MYQFENHFTVYFQKIILILHYTFFHQYVKIQIEHEVANWAVRDYKGRFHYVFICDKEPQRQQRYICACGFIVTFLGDNIISKVTEKSRYNQLATASTLHPLNVCITKHIIQKIIMN